ncbi:MAG TPA: nucleotidyltransferase domain-containing protein, partial [Pirellulales bacterium]|nr:nucleotidyltransferase domain-containing protein [Pirellulales bacterium]
MQKAGRTLAPRWWLADRIREYMRDKLGFTPDEASDACDRIIRYLAERTGLIEERGLDSFGFSHRTLQEYFASLGVNDEADGSPARDTTDFIRGYSYHPEWCEVVRLLAAQLTPALAESLIRGILDDPDPVGRFLKRGPLLSLKCLSDGTTIADRRLISSIFDSLVELGRSKWLGITFEAMDVLEGLEGTRLEASAKATMAAILDTAKSSLPRDDYACLHHNVTLPDALEQAQHNLFPEVDLEAGRIVSLELDGAKVITPLLNIDLLLSEPDKWYKSACSILDDDRQDLQLRQMLVCELGGRVGTDRRAAMRLRKILAATNPPASLRALAASAMASAAGERPGSKRFLLRILERDRDNEVRAACAAGLVRAAAGDEQVAKKLRTILTGRGAKTVRCGAAAGLSAVALTAEDITGELLRCAAGAKEPVTLRQSCGWALRPQLGKNEQVTDLFKLWLNLPKPAILQQLAAQGLASAMADESVAWDVRLVEKIEHILMNVAEPCPHALESLRELANARAVRGGLRLETVLADSLRPVVGAIELSFVFGSTARNRQTQDSDIDLLILGEVTLKDLSAPLRKAESTLGRRINPAIYTLDAFRRKYQAGDPFLLDVYRREKLFVMSRRAGASQKDLDDELRVMVAERLVAAV